MKNMASDFLKLSERLAGPVNKTVENKKWFRLLRKNLWATSPPNGRCDQLRSNRK